VKSRSEFSGTAARVFVGALVGCVIAMFLGVAPGRVFWSLAGTAVVLVGLVVTFVVELLRKSDTQTPPEV
jgi:Na+/proline symporter